MNSSFVILYRSVYLINYCCLTTVPSLYKEVRESKNYKIDLYFKIRKAKVAKCKIQIHPLFNLNYFKIKQVDY